MTEHVTPFDTPAHGLLYQRVFEQGPLAITVVDTDLRYIQVNRRFCEMLGYCEAELLQRTFAEITHPDDVDLDLEFSQQVFQGAIPFFQIEKRFIRKDGGVIWGRLTATVIRDETDQPVYGLGMVEDVTAQKNAYLILRESADRLESLHQMDQAILENLSSEAIVDITLQHVRRLIPCERASIALYHHDRQGMTLIGAHFDGETSIGAGVELTFEQFGDIAALERGDVRWADDLHLKATLSEVDQHLMAEGLRSYINVPLVTQNQLIGSLNLASSQPGNFTIAEAQIAREIAAPVAIAFQQAQLQADLEIQSDALQQTNAELRREIRERQQAEGELRRYAERLELLHQMNLEMLSAHSPKAIAQEVVDRVPQLLPCQRASVVIFDLEAYRGHILAVYGMSPPSYRAGEWISLTDHFAFMQHHDPNRLYQIEDVIAMTKVVTTAPQDLQQVGLSSSVTAPILAQGRLIGALNIASDRPGEYTATYLEIVRMVVMALAAALQQAYLLEQVQHQAESLEKRVAERTAELEAAQQDLLRQARLATLGQLTATVSHELRNPLATLRTSFYSIDQHTRGRGLGVERALDRVDRNITRCDNIIGELLDYTRMPPLNVQLTRLDEWLREVVSEYELPEAVELVYALSPNIDMGAYFS